MGTLAKLFTIDTMTLGREAVCKRKQNKMYFLDSYFLKTKNGVPLNSSPFSLTIIVNIKRNLFVFRIYT